MPVYDIAIIGGGLSGLSAGAALSRKGYRVLLLEQHHVPGGCATTFKRKEFVMEAGLHAMDGHLIDESRHHSLLRYLGVLKHLNFLPLPEFFHLRSPQINFTFPHGTQKAKEALMEKFPGEGKAIQRYFRLIMGIQDELERLPRKRSQQVMEAPLFPYRYPKLTFNYRRSVGSYLDHITDNDDLKLILLGNLLYYHDDPYSMSLLFFAKAQASFIHYGGYFIKGGSQQLSNALVQVIRKNKGEVLLGKMAEEILIKNGQAAGVRFRDTFRPTMAKESVVAKQVIHSGALPLLPDLLKGEQRKLIQKKIKGMEAATSLFCVYIGFSREIADVTGGNYSTFFQDASVKKLKDLKSSYRGPWEQRGFVFVDYSRVDAALAPPNKAFGVICTSDNLADWEGLDEATYKQKKQAAADILLHRLEEAMPGISERIEYCEAATARTIKHYTQNPAGAPYGFAQTPSQAGMNRPGSRSPVKNLLLAGTWTFPGGGFTGALVSGFLAATEAIEQLGKPENLASGKAYKDEREMLLLHKGELGPNTQELILQKPEGFEYRPGQYIHLGLSGSTGLPLDMPIRTLSIASHPSEEVLRFIMRHSSSPYKVACSSLEPGEKVLVFGPEGNFTLQENGRDPVFLVAGIGISPVLPMLQELEVRQYKGRVSLLYTNRNEEDATCHGELENVKLEGWDYHPVFTSQRERITKKDIQELEAFKQRDYYIVGGTSFLESMRQILDELLLLSSQIFTDDFG